MIRFCPECHLVIAPRDPEARFLNGVRFHNHCFKTYWLRLDAQHRARKELKEARHVQGRNLRVVPEENPGGPAHGNR